MRNHGSRITAYGLSTLTVLCLFGCTDQGVDLGQFGRVSGRVTHHGIALQKGIITFNCPDSGQVATVDIQPDGTYVMKLGDREGLPLGKYKVSVRPPLARSQEHFRRPGSAQPQDNVDSDYEIPVKFRFETSSRLTAAVEEGDNTFNFDLSDGSAS